jgi:hypothetical protein
MFTMANIAAFHLLYTCAIASLCQQHSGQHWTLNIPSSSRIRPIQLSGDRPLLSTARWHTNNPSTTTPVHRHAPKKHIHKKPILLAFTAKQKYSLCGGFHSIPASEAKRRPKCHFHPFSTIQTLELVSHSQPQPIQEPILEQWSHANNASKCLFHI